MTNHIRPCLKIEPLHRPNDEFALQLRARMQQDRFEVVASQGSPGCLLVAASPTAAPLIALMLTSSQSLMWFWGSVLKCHLPMRLPVYPSPRRTYWSKPVQTTLGCKGVHSL